MNRLDVLKSTIRQLYGSANSCAYPSCDQPLLRTVPGSQEPILNSRVAHIRAASPGGPRYDEEMSDEDRRSFANLLLLCPIHADEIDHPALLHLYPVKVLENWKRLQLEEAEGSPTLSLPDTLLEKVLTILVAQPRMDVTGSTLALGGQGGQAPGAGGGGGGAVGPNARAGDGGPGGSQASLKISADELTGTVPIIVGQGARPGVAGMPGECGGHSRFGAVIVHGGGREVHTVHARDVDGLDATISAGLLVNYAEIRDGLAYLAGAGWDRYNVADLPAPFSAGLCVWVDITLDAWNPAKPVPVEVIAELFTPTSHVTLSQRVRTEFRVQDHHAFVRLPIAISLRGSLYDEGLHVLHLSCNDESHVDTYLKIVVADDS